MKKLDYASLFLSMVSLVWMLTMLQELPAVAQTTPAAADHPPLTERISLAQAAELLSAAQRQD